MALFKVLLASLFLFLLVLNNLVDAHTEIEEHTLATNDARGNYPSQKINCGAACAARCRLASRPNRCKRACGTCCARCNCVPPGTSGNREQCPCYANMTTRGNKLKCP